MADDLGFPLDLLWGHIALLFFFVLKINLTG
jgi:hypothetical protein